MPNPCVWPTSERTRCEQVCQEGQLCAEHLKRVRNQVGSWDCAWPGCVRTAWDKKGLCSFHTKVAFGPMDL
jgi:hypothetical protein